MSKPNFTMLKVALPKDKYPIKATNPMTPIGITIHETDNNAPARNEIAYMQRNDNVVSFHIAVDESEIIQGVPFDRNAWHSGDGNNGTGNRKTIAIEICRNYKTDDMNDYYKARTNAEKVVGWLMYTYGWSDKDIYTHNDWNGKNCPRVIRSEGYLNTFKQNAMKERNQYLEKPSTGGVVVAPVKKTTQQLVNEVMAGVHGSGDARRKSLGSRYDEVQNAINAQYSDKPAVKPAPVKTTQQLVDEVMAGKHGSGETRRVSLGSRYDEVQNAINKGSTPKPVEKPKAKTTQQLVDEVMAGKHGSGDARRKSLGSRFDEVQNAINKSQGVAPVAPKPSAKPQKSVATLAAEVNQGLHGNGADRRKSLGSRYDEVQDYINGVKPSPKASPIKVGDMVLVNAGARSYEGVQVASTWNRTRKVVSQINGNRVLLDIDGWCTAFHMKDLRK